MSESSKMGLFDSKDDNTGAAEAGSENNEAPKAKENSEERHNAPYNIDSDSETYDTEALSIMDINDIIGVQAESANDSTLESEFAALSEVITDCKDEFSSKIAGAPGTEDKAVGKSDKNRENYSTQENREDSTKEDPCGDSQADDKKVQDSAGMSSMSKSLQLIGEAYISDDSQETDTEETSKSNVPKVAELIECSKASKSDSEDAEKVPEKLSGETVQGCSNETIAEEKTAADATAQKTAEEPKKIAEEEPKSSRIDKSTDLTDSAIIEKSTAKPAEDDKTESMDVDCSPPHNIVESEGIENQSKCETEAKENNEVENSQVGTSVAETEEPMEVDQTIDDLSAKVENKNIDSAIEPEEIIISTEKSSEPPITEQTKILSESSAVNKTLPQPEDVEESVAPLNQQEASVEVSNVAEEETVNSAEGSREEKSVTEKLETNTDVSEIEESIADKVEFNKLQPEVEESANEVATIVENATTAASADKTEEPEDKPDSPKKVTSDVEDADVVESEPMEVDDNKLIIEQTETESNKCAAPAPNFSDNDSNSVDSASDILLKESTNAEPVVAVVESALFEDVETAQNESAPESTEKAVGEESGNRESTASVSDSPKQSLTEKGQIDSTEVVESKESAYEEPDISAAESSEAPLTIERPEIEAISADTVEGFTERIPTERVGEDERMEVDASTKREKEEVEEESEETRKLEATSKELEDSPAEETIVPEVDIANEEESADGKAVESDIQEASNVCPPVESPEVAETENSGKKSEEVSIEASSTTSHEIETTETLAEKIPRDDVEHQKDVDKADFKTEEMELSVATEKEESPESKTMETPEEVATEIEENSSKPEMKEQAPDTSIAIETENKEEEIETKQEEGTLNTTETTEQETLSPGIEKNNTEVPAIEAQSTIEAESEDVFSKPNIPNEAITRKSMPSSSVDLGDAEEEAVEEEMNLSLDPQLVESREPNVEEAQSMSSPLLSSGQMSVDPDEDIEDNVEMNLSLDPEEKSQRSPIDDRDGTNKITVEDCVGESSMTSTAEKPEEGDEPLDKSCDDIDENSKDIEPTTVSVSEIYHDDQSQTTQEMMESILETDTGNLNKILDAEEAEGEALARANALRANEQTEIDELSDKSPSESEELLNKALDDPMASQNIDSLEGLLDLDLIPETDEAALKVVEPIGEKVMNETEKDIETIDKDVDVALLLDGSEQPEVYASDDPKVMENIAAAQKIAEAVDSVAECVDSELMDNDLDENFDLASVVPDPLEAVPLASEDNKLDLAEDLLREIAVEEERKMELAEQLFLEGADSEASKIDLPDDLLLQTADQGTSKNELADEVLLENAEENMELPDPVLLQSDVEAEQDIVMPDPDLLQSAGDAEADQDIALDDSVLLQSADDNDQDVVLADPILLQAVVPEDSKIELSEDISLDSAVRDRVLTDVTAEIEDLAPSSEISELESAVKFLQESEEQDIDSPLILSPKLVESVVDDIEQESDVGIFAADADICEDPSGLVAELESIIPDPIAISEAEIISEAAKLENEKKSKEEAKLQSPILKIIEKQPVEFSEITSPPLAAQESMTNTPPLPETPKTHREPRQTIVENRVPEKIDNPPLLTKSVPIPKISILEERLKIPPKIEIPVGEVSRICEMPTTPKTSLLIQRDTKLAMYQKMLESPKGSEKTELKIVDTPRKDSEKHDFENVGSPRIILKIAKSAIADCGEPRSPKSPKIRSATNSPNPEDSPGQKLGKIKLKLSKGGHPSIIPNDNVEEICGQWHTEGTSSLSPLGMKIKFSKTGDASIVQAEKHEPSDDTKEQPKHKFEEAKRTESPIGMKIKLSRTGDPSIVPQDAKESTSKHKDKMEMMQGSPKRTESPIGMKIKLSKSGDASIIQPQKEETSDEYREGSRGKDKLDVPQDIPRRTESPLGMKIKLFKTGDASIVQPEPSEDSPQEVKRTDSPLGMKIKLSKTRGASIVTSESSEDGKEKLEIPDVPRRTESPLGMKFKLSKSGDASIIHSEESKESSKHRERAESSQDSSSESSLGVKIKVTKSGDASIVQPEASVDSDVRTSSIGMKIKLSKTGDASIVHSDSQEQSEDSRSKDRPEKTDSSIGMKIKLSKTGDASIIHSTQISEDPSSPESSETESKKSPEALLGMKIKLQKGGDASIVETDKIKDKSSRRKDTDSPLEMKIKLSKTGHPTIVACDNYGEASQRPKESILESSPHSHAHKHKESLSPKETSGMKALKNLHSPNMHPGRSELTIEPIQSQSRKGEAASEESPKRKDVTISPVESKKAKLEAKLSQMLPEVTIQPITPRDQKSQMMFESKASSISRQQMNVISQEISITQVRPSKPMDLSITDKLKSMLTKNANTSANSDCEIIERHPELIIVNENSNSSQEVMIIEEVPALRGPDAKVPKKRGRPRRNPLPLILAKPLPQGMMPTDPTLPRDPLALDELPQTVGQMLPQNFAPKENERPKRTCSRQKSYAPPRRGRGRGGGRGKRKIEMAMELSKKPRIEQDLDMIERSTTALLAMDEPATQPSISHKTSELYKALRQPPMDSKIANTMARVEAEQAANDASLMAKSRIESLMDSRLMSHLGGVMETNLNKSPAVDCSFDSERKMSLESLCSSEGQVVHMVTDQMEKSELLANHEKIMDKAIDEVKDGKDASHTADHQNWLTPSLKKQLDGRNEGNISNVQVMDEETRMSAESGSRSQTPARNMSVQAPETIVNEESQGSVLSTATTESEKVKVKNRRMEINFDPDEGPFTVDKVAEYEWPPDPTRKGETFMIQEQISQYLGVKSFKRKYPDLKRRMVDMEERNFLRENGLVSEAMCDMGLTAVSSSEVLDVMCNDFPDQYEEYRKYIREKQMKEHSKKQKELTAAANAERNRIDLAEMAVQSALSWNVGLNKARRESRKCSLDLQTFTIHVPKKQQKVEEESKVSHYPVALIPGQYTDYYREYTPAELRYYPLNTVLYGPMKPNERKFDSQSEGSQSDSDSDSSSDDSSSSSSDGTQDTEESQSTMDEVDVELSRQKEDIKSIKCKMCLKHLNKFSRTEVLIQCGTCNGYVHPSCIDLTLDMVPHIQAYAWQCTDCKTCAQCHDPADEDKMLFCDMCDRGYHIYCVGLRRVPQGRWHCQECAVCASCGSREAGGANSDRNSVAQWQHEYKKGDKNTRVYVSTLCVPCSKLWRKGRYCPHCSRCHTVPRLDLEANLVHCSACDKYLHLGCVETKDLIIDRKNYLCDFCQPSRQQMVKPLVSKVFRT